MLWLLNYDRVMVARSYIGNHTQLLLGLLGRPDLLAVFKVDPNRLDVANSAPIPELMSRYLLIFIFCLQVDLGVLIISFPKKFSC